jgi:TIR domain
MNVSPITTPRWDIFFSHRTAHYSEVRPLVDALKDTGLKIWIDRESVRPFDSIDNRIKDGLALCRLLVAYYTRDYGRSRACQWELTSAYIAGEQEGDAARRIAVIRGGPTDGVDYIHPIALRSGKFLDLPDSSDAEATAACVGAIRERCAGLSSAIGNIVSATPAPWYPQSCSPTPFPALLEGFRTYGGFIRRFT